MHIPDGYLSPQTCATLYAAAAPFWYVSLRRVGRALGSELIPLIGVFSAFCFVIMMFNLPLPGGTTGHAVGVGMAAIVLGPWASILAISTALVVQALLFGDGGITAIGANCFNMAVAGSLVTYCTYRLLAGRSALVSKRRAVAAAVAGYVAINAAAFCAAVEFGIQPALFHDAQGVPLYCPYRLSVALPAMMIGHLTLAGLAELVLTAGIVVYLQKTDPALLQRTAPRSALKQPLAVLHPARSLRRFWLALAVLVVLTPLGILAVGSAWGEWSVADFSSGSVRPQTSGDVRSGAAPPQAPRGLARLSELWRAPLARYSPRFVASASWGYMLSAAAGVAAILLLALIAPGVTTRLAARRATLKPSFIEKTVRSLCMGLERSLFAEEIARSPGWLQQFDPRVKLAGIAMMVITAVTVRRLPTLLGLFVFAIAIAASSQIPLRLLAKTVWLPALLFTGAVALPALIVVPGPLLYRLPLVGWAITEPGFAAALRLVLRVEAATTFSAILFFTTEWARVLRALRILRVPAVAVTLLGFSYRYLFVFLRAAQEMFEARRSRHVGELHPRDRRRLAASSAGTLLLKTFDLGADVHAAMRSRGFQGEMYLLDENALRLRDGLFITFFLLLAVSVVLFGK